MVTEARSRIVKRAVHAREVEAAAWLLLGMACIYRWHSSLGNPAHTADFYPVWHASYILLHGGTFYSSGPYGFVYLPSAATVFLPFRALGLHAAVSLSIALQLVCIVGACCLIVRAYNGPRLIIPISALVMVLSEATLSAEIFGNVDLYIPLFVAWMIFEIDRGDHKLAGIAYGASVAIKPLVVVPALLGLWRRNRSFLLTAIAVVVVLSLPGVLLTNVGLLFHKVLPFVANGEPTRVIQVQSTSINGVLRHEPKLLLTILRGAVGLMGAFTCISLGRRHVPESIRWLEVTVAGQVTVGLDAGYTFAHHLALALLLIPATAAPMAVSRRVPVLVPVLLLALPRHLPGWTMQSQQCVAMALVLIAMAYAACTPRRAPEGISTRAQC